MLLVTFLTVSMCVFPAAAVSDRTAPTKKYLSDKVCWETYGTTLGSFYKIRDKEICGVKCTETIGCQSLLYNKNAGWCTLNSGVFSNKTTVGCSNLVDYLEVTTNTTLRQIPPPTHCGPVPYVSSILVDKSSGNYSIGAQFPYHCTPCTSFPPPTSPGVVTCGADGRWIIPSDPLCVYGPDVGLLRNGDPIPSGAVGCNATFNETGCTGYVSSGLGFTGFSGGCFCDSVCCSASDCCFDAQCMQNVKDFAFLNDYYYYY